MWPTTPMAYRPTPPSTTAKKDGSSETTWHDREGRRTVTYRVNADGSTEATRYDPDGHPLYRRRTDPDGTIHVQDDSSSTDDSDN